jgi:hypothetical protein
MEKEEREKDYRIKSFHYQEKIDGIQTQFFSALKDFQKYFVYYHKNPEVDDFQQQFQISKGQLQMLSDQLLQITSQIHSDIRQLDGKMESVAKQLEMEKMKYNKLTSSATHLENTQNGSEILIDDYKSKYNQQYYRNVRLYIGILLMFMILGVLTNNKSTSLFIIIISIFTFILLAYNLSVLFSLLLFLLFIAFIIISLL